MKTIAQLLLVKSLSFFLKTQLLRLKSLNSPVILQTKSPVLQLNHQLIFFDDRLIPVTSQIGWCNYPVSPHLIQSNLKPDPYSENVRWPHSVAPSVRRSAGRGARPWLFHNSWGLRRRSRLWEKGPGFLWHDPGNWPKTAILLSTKVECSKNSVKTRAMLD